MSASPRSRFLRPAVLAALMGATLALVGCASGVDTAPSETAPVESSETGAPGPGSSDDGSDGADCAGVRVVVDFGELDQPSLNECVDTEASLNAIDAFAQAGVELTEGQAFVGSICRVAGLPAAGVELTFDGNSYAEDCTTMGPVWAYWGLFIDQGEGWGYAQEGVATQLIEPGQGISFSWQFGDTTEPQLPSV